MDVTKRGHGSVLKATVQVIAQILYTCLMAKSLISENFALYEESTNSGSRLREQFCNLVVVSSKRQRASISWSWDDRE